MIFSKMVKSVREIKGYSQEQLARELDVSFATINRWENGKTEPSRLALKNFIDFCKKKRCSDFRRGSEVKWYVLMG